MSFLVFANTTAGRAAARRFAAAVDVELGFPRDHAGRVVGRTEGYCRIVRAADGQLAVEIDDTVRALEGRVVTVRDGSDLQITITLTGADRTEVARLTGWPSGIADVNPWIDRPARDGLDGARDSGR